MPQNPETAQRYVALVAYYNDKLKLVYKQMLPSNCVCVCSGTALSLAHPMGVFEEFSGGLYALGLTIFFVGSLLLQCAYLVIVFRLASNIRALEAMFDPASKTHFVAGYFRILNAVIPPKHR